MIKFVIEKKSILGNVLAFYAYEQVGDVIRVIGPPMMYNETSPEAQNPPALLHLKPNEAQEIMDQLWYCGLRPSEGTGSAGSLAATQEHLEDMRDIVFNILKIRKEDIHLANH